MTAIADWLIPIAGATAVITVPALPLDGNEVVMILLAAVSGIAWLIRVSLRREKQLIHLEERMMHILDELNEVAEDVRDFRKQMRGADCITCATRVKYKHMVEQQKAEQEGE